MGEDLLLYVFLYDKTRQELHFAFVGLLYAITAILF